MPKLFSLLCAICILLSAEAQDIKPCGTPPVKTDWFKNYVENPAYYQRTPDSIQYVPLKIHNVGTDNGESFFSEADLLTAMCILNQDYEGTGIQFYIYGDINYLSNSAYNSHESVLDGADMMFANNVEDVLNIYFVSNPAGNCGYNLPYAGIAMNKGCSGANSHTFAHEVGHAFSVQHPHLGWDGNTYDPSQETPTLVTYDYTYFKDTLIRDTLIIDTSIVELADGSNCSEAGDFLCDTGPDYLSTRWQCNSNGESSTSQTDPNGESFRSDATLIMSYAVDECSYRFTDEQVLLMKANLATDKADYLITGQEMFPITEQTVLSYPLDELVHYENIEIGWETTANASQYILELSRIPNFAFIEERFIVDSNVFVIPELRTDQRYFWRVRPYNAYSFCTDYSEPGEFETGVLSSTQAQNEHKLRIYPSLLRAGKNINIDWDAELQTSESSTEVKIIDAHGRLLRTERQQSNIISTDGLQSGMYFIVITRGQKKSIHKVIIM